MKKFVIIVLLILSACKSNNPHIVQKFPEDQNLERKQRAGNMFGNKEGIILFEDKRGEDKTSETQDDAKPIKSISKNNKDLWEKAVNLVSSILPISIVDENLGLITTDWGNINQISSNNDLYKLNIIVKQNSSKDDITISAFKKTDDGKSEKAPEIEEKIKDLIIN